MQFAASVTVTVNVPAAKFEMPAVVSPLLQRYETEPLAPLSEAVAPPVVPPLQATFVPVAEATSAHVQITSATVTV